MITKFVKKILEVKKGVLKLKILDYLFQQLVGKLIYSSCGFHSLHCCANCLQFLTSPPIEDLLIFAKENGFTNIGELFSGEVSRNCFKKRNFTAKNFSANWMVKIAEHFWADDADFEAVPFPSAFEMANRLRGNNSLLLVPYDCDKNSEPCNRGGQAAHWAIVVREPFVIACSK